MSDTRGLLDRITAFRQRLESVPALVPEALPLEPADGPAVVVEAVGSPASTRVAVALIRPGGHLSIASDCAGCSSVSTWSDGARRLR